MYRLQFSVLVKMKVCTFCLHRRKLALQTTRLKHWKYANDPGRKHFIG